MGAGTGGAGALTAAGMGGMRMFDGIQFNSLSEFFAMGGYAFNVWSVYALFAIFLIANLALPLRKRRLILREQKRRLAVLDARDDSAREPADSAGWEVSMAGDEK